MHTNRDDFDRREDDYDSLFERHFPERSNDLTLVVLKGHLLLEQSINRLLAVLLRFPEAIEGANLRFHQKVCLIRALSPTQLPVMPGAADVLDVVEKLNTLRNRLAHHLDHPEIEARAKEILSLCEVPKDLMVKKPGDEMEADPLIHQLKQKIAWVCILVHQLSEGLKGLTWEGRV
jgi:hypothetical protein